MGIFRRLIPTGGVDDVFSIDVTVSAGQTFTLPIADYGSFTPTFTVDWGDSTSSSVTSSTDSNRIHTYVSGGTYTINITGFMPAWVVSNNSAIRSLIVSINHFGNVGLRNINFYGCSNLAALPNSSGTAINNLGLSNVVTFANFMRSTGITSIASGIFDYAVNATTFTDAFSFTNITSIPNGLFNNNSAATIFSSTFNGCSSLSSYPSTLFDNCPNVVNFASCFRNCRQLTSCLTFSNNTAVTTFANLYNMSTTTNAMDGNAPTLWTRIPEPFGIDAFNNCLGLDNYASIPSNWK
jgi:hypothetical protein